MSVRYTDTDSGREAGRGYSNRNLQALRSRRHPAPCHQRRVDPDRPSRSASLVRSPGETAATSTSTFMDSLPHGFLCTDRWRKSNTGHTPLHRREIDRPARTRALETRVDRAFPHCQIQARLSSHSLWATTQPPTSNTSRVKRSGAYPVCKSTPAGLPRCQPRPPEDPRRPKCDGGVS